MTKKLYKKFENYLKENDVDVRYIWKNDYDYFDMFYKDYCRDRDEDDDIVHDWDKEVREANIKHNKEILKSEMEDNSGYIKEAIKANDTKYIEIVMHEYLRIRRNFIDDGNNMLYLYIDFKDDAELNELTEIETQILRNIFRETYEKFNTGWYNAA